MLEKRAAVVQKETEPSERRRERRIPVDRECDSAALTFIGGEKIDVTIVNVSRSGIGIRSSTTLLAGTYVEVRWPSTAVFGEIRHCRKVGNLGFEAGMLIDDLLDASALTTSPHLTRPTLDLFLSGALSPEDTDAASNHITACPLCSKAVFSPSWRTL